MIPKYKQRWILKAEGDRRNILAEITSKQAEEFSNDRFINVLTLIKLDPQESGNVGDCPGWYKRRFLIPEPGFDFTHLRNQDAPEEI